MTDAMERVLQLVADGRLSAAEAEPILAALDERESTAPPDSGASSGGPSDREDAAREDRARYAHIEVTEGGRRAVDLRIPLALGSLGLGSIPGLSSESIQRVREAIDAGMRGPVFQVEDTDGDGVRIVIE
jgi:hypothetical protein